MLFFCLRYDINNNQMPSQGFVVPGPSIDVGRALSNVFFVHESGYLQQMSIYSRLEKDDAMMYTEHSL